MLYVFGGIGSGDGSADIDVSDSVFRFAGAGWTKCSPLPRPLLQATAVMCGGKIHLVGGITVVGRSVRSISTYDYVHGITEIVT